MICVCKLLFLIACLRLHFSTAQRRDKNGWKGNKMRIEIPDTYSRYALPANFTSDNQVKDPARVMLMIFPVFITRLSMRHMDFTIDIMVRVEWLDHRLKTPNATVIGRTSLLISSETFAKMWSPRLKFMNCKGSVADVVPEDSKDAVLTTRTGFAREMPNSVAIFVSYRKEITFRCDLNFAAYPFDIQQCDIIVQLSHENKDDIQLTVTDMTEYSKYITVPPGFRLANFNLIYCGNIKMDNRELAYYSITYKYIFNFQRIFAQHIMLIYIPSLLIVSLSWISFWLDVKNAAPRIALGLTSLLTLSTQFNNAQKDLPAVAEIKAIDVWMFACMFMVFAALVEYAVIVFCDSKQPAPAIIPRRNIPFPNEFKLKDQVPSAWVESQRHKPRSRLHCCLVPPGKIDKIACVFFPTMFILFNFGYWSYFLIDVEGRFHGVKAVC